MNVSSPSVSSRRTFLRGSLAAAAVGMTGTLLPSGAASAARAPAKPFVAYSTDAAFRMRVNAVSVDSTATASFRRFMVTHPDQKSLSYPKLQGLDSNKWGTAYAMGLASHPVWRLTGTVPKEVADLKTRGFHAPEWFGAMLTGTSDSPFVVVDRGMGQSVWASKATVVAPYTISVGAAGRFMHASNGLDRRNPKSNNTLNFRSRGAIPDAMVIRRDLVDAGIAAGTGLGHVLHMFLVETNSAAGFCHPMVGTESGKYGWGAEGQRLAIASDVNLTKRGLSPAALVIARTLQQHGAYIGDNAGGGSTLKAEQATSERDVWNGLLNQASLKGITWNDFVVLRTGA